MDGGKRNLPQGVHPKTSPEFVSESSEEDATTIASLVETGVVNNDTDTQFESLGRPITVGVCYYNYEAFMSRRAGDEADYVIEVLLTKSNPRDEFNAEESRRAMATNGRRDPRVSTDVEDFGDDRRLHRVRIRSQTILSFFPQETYSNGEPPQSYLFCRPFGMFQYYYESMKMGLADLEAAAISKTVPESYAANNASSDEGSFTTAEDNRVADMPSAPPENALEHMRIYIQFVEEKILPLCLQYQPRQTRCMILYEDIPFLFKPGELVFYQVAPPTGRALHRSAAQQVWRMHQSFVVKASEAGRWMRSWEIYSLDFDGEDIVCIWRQVNFEFFHGEKDVTELECFPLRFHTNHKSILKEQKETGLMFKEAISGNIQHLYHSGWTFVTGILAETLEDDKGSVIKYSEYIESDVVLDYKETIRTFPQWQTYTDKPKPHPQTYSMHRSAEIPLLLYSDDPAEAPTQCRQEKMAYGESYSRGMRECHYVSGDIFIQEHPDFTEYTWTDEDLALLPKRIFGYVLRERRFSRLDATCIQWNATQNKTTLDNIEMNDGHRRIIRSAVLSHFKAQQLEKSLNISTFNLDAIRGKGKGLTILLHGAPGVGKTATAEAIAIECNKPLFPITCGDLGTEPEVVDKTLRDIFRYAHLWECILLLDEADVFLSQRERSSLHRNTLVGVFLRVLEYYRGVLFLTTNRVGALDEAFRSRVHVSLWYPYLTAERTIKVLRRSLDRLPQPPAADGKPVYGLIKVMYSEIEDFVREEYVKYSRTAGHERGPWNGRQIRNAVQVAACLALYQKETDESKDDYPAVLTASHFQSVAETTSGFESFLKKTRIGDDSYWAQQRNDRADDWRDASDHGDDEYHFEAEDIIPAHKPSRQMGGSFLDKDSRATEHMALPAGRRGLPQRGDVPTVRRAPTHQPSARPSRHAVARPYGYNDDRSNGYDYDDMASTATEAHGSRRLLSGGGSPRRPAAPLEHSSKASRRRFPDDSKDLDDSCDMLSEEEGHMDEWAPGEDSRSWRGAPTPIPHRGRGTRGDEAQFTAPRRDRRAGEGYGEDRRQHMHN